MVPGGGFSWSWERELFRVLGSKKGGVLAAHLEKTALQPLFLAGFHCRAQRDSLGLLRTLCARFHIRLRSETKIVAQLHHEIRVSAEPYLPQAGYRGEHVGALAYELRSRRGSVLSRACRALLAQVKRPRCYALTGRN
jgi:hypothetical protein